MNNNSFSEKYIKHRYHQTTTPFFLPLAISLFLILALPATRSPLSASQNQNTGNQQKKQQPPNADPIFDTVCEIQKLESNRDPKCHATATRLENFIYGTPLTPETRFLKVKLQKKILLQLWEKASQAAEKENKPTLTAADFQKEIKGIFQYATIGNGDIEVKSSLQTPIILTKRDMEHYSSVAYALRSILALQQEMMFQTQIKLKAIAPDAISTLKEFLDTYTLAALNVADRQARKENKYAISPETFQKAWDKIGETTPLTSAALSPGKLQGKTVPGYPVLKEIIHQKIKSYEAYNNISMQVFLRNLQVYFARHRWPSDPETARRFKALFTETMIAFAFESMKLADKTARASGRPFIREEDVDKMWKEFVPFHVNEYEDVIFFPKLGASGSVTIEAYDFDAFRDSGIHWRYLQAALLDNPRAKLLEPDPFAAELLVEGIAQFGVLALRLAGMEAKKAKDETLKPLHLENALREIRERSRRHATAKQTKMAHSPRSGFKGPGHSLVSSGHTTRLSSAKTYFNDVTARSGINFMHRSSDWLSRLLRSYVKKSPTVGRLAIPPSFGGSGVAAGDVNGDGITDVLLLSGTGNALYLGDGNGRFRDITQKAGIRFTRKDGTFGEPRQPIIADFDNDGHQDILITYVQDDHKLYRNLGGGTFADVSKSARLGGQNLVGGPALVFDYDRDGLLDIYICYFGDYVHGIYPTLARRNHNGLPNKLFRNKGNMRFEDVTQKSGVGDTGWGQAASHTDLDGDGWQDIIVGNDFGVNVYYRNRGDGTFQNVAHRIGTGKPSFTMNIGITDLNRDGAPDIYVSNIVTMVKDEKYVMPGAQTTMKFNPKNLARMRVIEANDLFLSGRGKNNQLQYTLSDAVGRGDTSTGWAWGADFFDFDNDGDDDLYCTNGMNEYSVYSDTPYYTQSQGKDHEVRMPVYEKESNVFFVNEGGKLHNHSKQSGADLLGNSRSSVYVDFDNDGDLDIILNNYHGPAHVYRNNSQSLNNRWLKLTLTGDPEQNSNRDAIGARIQVYKSRTAHGIQLSWREVRGGQGYLSMEPKTQHMGVGGEKVVDLKITWPNGEKVTLKNIVTNRHYHLRQGKELIAKN